MLTCFWNIYKSFIMWIESFTRYNISFISGFFLLNWATKVSFVIPSFIFLVVLFAQEFFLMCKKTNLAVNTNRYEVDLERDAQFQQKTSSYV